MYTLKNLSNDLFAVKAENGLEIGSLRGAKGEWTATVSNAVLGVFETQDAAATAICKKLEITGIFDQMRIIVEDSQGLLQDNRHQFFMHTQAQVQSYRCATDLFWILHASGSIVIPLDLPTSANEINAALASTNNSNRVLYIVDTGPLLMYEIDEASISRRIARQPRYHLHGKHIWNGPKRLASIRIMQPQGFKAADRKCQVEINCEVEPSEQEAAALSKIGFAAPQVVPGRDVFSKPIQIDVLYKNQKPFSWKIAA